VRIADVELFDAAAELVAQPAAFDHRDEIAVISVGPSGPTRRSYISAVSLLVPPSSSNAPRRVRRSARCRSSLDLRPIAALRCDYFETGDVDLSAIGLGSGTGARSSP
jgi:hypothetical protein